ncbi:branched-chain amino acid ABC transporter substrate-binding protein, partial [Candidatus Micrarchaeota archaeon]|nr:branched-chain amino acid ABC transporter substrate-binding protein [Candidatus Micrarchaeota archaeon]MBU1930992.1 branched-chain amino acid ABC transporter substrate-binding protein [Candidatus Micrarchaeota archaeon]
ATAIKETDSIDSAVLKEYLKSIKDYEGASGNLEFGSTGGVLKNPILQIVEDGQLIAYQE